MYIVKFMILSPLQGPMCRAKTAKKNANFKKFSSLLSHMWEKNQMHCYSVHEAIYQNC